MITESSFREYRTMLNLDGIVAFVAVAEAGSISEAARRLWLSKSVVSERLAAYRMAASNVWRPAILGL
jgi:Bacterial regulatory helix-turn-helix protein, lysR family